MVTPWSAEQERTIPPANVTAENRATGTEIPQWSTKLYARTVIMLVLLSGDRERS